MDGRQAADVADRVVEQHHAGQVGNPHHVDAGVQQVDVQAFDLLGLGQRQGDVQAADVVLGDQCAQVLEATEDRIEAVARQFGTVRGNQADHRLVLIAHQLVGKLEGELSGADDQRGPVALQLLVIAARDVV
ncbi:hypothetical protein D3C78_1177390 [compost metagenome]